jgi:putative serine protease PepD
VSTGPYQQQATVPVQPGPAPASAPPVQATAPAYGPPGPHQPPPPPPQSGPPTYPPTSAVPAGFPAPSGPPIHGGAPVPPGPSPYGPPQPGPGPAIPADATGTHATGTHATGFPGGPVTGIPYGPASGVPYGPASGVPYGPASGVPGGLASGVPGGPASGVPGAPVTGMPGPMGGPGAPMYGGPGTPTGGGSGAAASGGSKGLRVTVYAVVAILLVAVAVQAYALVHLSGRLSDANKRVDASNTRISTLERNGKSVSTKLNNSMDSITVAAKGLPSVFQVDAGDYLGTGWGVAHPSGGGTDLITNFHVISSIYDEGKRTLDIDHKSERYSASVKRVNKTQDLALLHVSETFPILQVSKTAQPGEPVVVLGEPLGLEDTVTVGVVSALRRKIPGLSGRTFIQFDAAINPGNSGGPVVNAHEQVVGIASDKLTDAEGLALAIPVSTACTYLQTC